jgi:phage repressor protein C with HTH and peptisase S24 domain
LGQNSDQSISERVEEVADTLFNGNVSDPVRATDMNPPSFYKYVNGQRNPGTTVLARLARLGVNINWVLSGEGHLMQSTSDFFTPLPLIEAMGPAEIDGPDEVLVRIPLVRVVAGTGEGPWLEEIGAPEWLPKTFVRQTYGVDPDLLKGFRISGDAMQDALRPGDRVRGALWQGDSLIDGSIYLLYREPGGVIVRRVRFVGDEVLLTADHPDVPDLEIDTDRWTQTFRPVAQVLEYVRAL